MAARRVTHWHPLEEAAFARDWHAGLTLRQLAAKYNVTSGVVGYTARRLGLPKRRPGRRPRDNAPVAAGEWRRVRGVMRWVSAA